jgi:2-hydroxychromene-2-carboxylate isomerase
MSDAIVTLYSDYKSPYAYLAKAPAYALEDAFDIALHWLPYTLDIPSYLGTVEDRSPHAWRRVRYSYMDARRIANKQGLIVRGPQKIFDSRPASIGLLYAQRHGVFRAYHDRVFELFWQRALDLADVAALGMVLAEAGAETADFARFVAAEGGIEHDRIRAEAEEAGIFGVPSFVFEGEIFWGGDRIDLLCERLEARDLRRR